MTPVGDPTQAKLRLFETLLPRGRTAVLNADSDAFPAVAAAAVAAGHPILSVGAMGRGLTLTGRTAEPHAQRLGISAWGRRHEVLLPLAGAFQASNALVAAGLAIAAGEAPDQVLAALEHLEGARGRLERVGADLVVVGVEQIVERLLGNAAGEGHK